MHMYPPAAAVRTGGRQCEGCNTHRDIVWFAFIADHKLNAYYYRVANSPQWKRIALDQVDFEDMGGCIRYVKVRSKGIRTVIRTVSKGFSEFTG